MDFVSLWSGLSTSDVHWLQQAIRRSYQLEYQRDQTLFPQDMIEPFNDDPIFLREVYQHTRDEGFRMYALLALRDPRQLLLDLFDDGLDLDYQSWLWEYVYEFQPTFLPKAVRAKLQTTSYWEVVRQAYQLEDNVRHPLTIAARKVQVQCQWDEVMELTHDMLYAATIHARITATIQLGDYTNLQQLYHDADPMDQTMILNILPKGHLIQLFFMEGEPVEFLPVLGMPLLSGLYYGSAASCHIYDYTIRKYAILNGQ